MFFSFDSTKAIQAIGVILGCHHCAMASKLRLLKLLYIADRESLQETGRPHELTGRRGPSVQKA